MQKNIAPSNRLLKNAVQMELGLGRHTDKWGGLSSRRASQELEEKDGLATG
jgi:hypothetical protein